MQSGIILATRTGARQASARASSSFWILECCTAKANDLILVAPERVRRHLSSEKAAIMVGIIIATAAS